MRVLVIAGDRGEMPNARSSLTELAGAQDLTITALTTYDDALRALVSGAADVCLLGERCGDRHGLELLAAAGASGASVPVLFVAAAGEPAGETRAFSLGAADCLVDRELTPAALSRALRVALARASAHQPANVAPLAAGLAHEINNPLAAVLANLDMLHDELARGGGAAARELLDDARQAAIRICEIVRDLKLFSRGNDERSSAVDVRRLLDSAARMATNEIRPRAQLVRELGDVPPVWANEARLGQVFLHLVVNAAHSIHDGDPARHRIRLRTYGAQNLAVVEVSDTGEGIAPDLLPHALEPYYSARRTGAGSGLSLAICQRIVHELGGTVEVTSEPGKGTTVRVQLPGHRPDAASTARPPGATASVPRGRVLVVDDEHMITTALSRVLGSSHDVTCFNDAEQALQAIRSGARYDVIICDLMMPQITGMELHAALDELAPDQAAAMVFLTGGAFTASGTAFLERVTNIRVEKPFSALQLRDLVNELVAARTGRA